MCSENKGTDQLYSNCTADLHLYFCLYMLLVFLCGGTFFMKKISGCTFFYIKKIQRYMYCKPTYFCGYKILQFCLYAFFCLCKNKLQYFCHNLFCYLSKCLAMTHLSTVWLDVGRVTGSVINVPMIGSRNSSGASAAKSSSCFCTAFTD